MPTLVNEPAPTSAPKQAQSNTLSSLQSLSKTSVTDEAERQALLLEAYDLVARLETPWETCLRWGMGQTSLYTSLKVASDLDLFVKWADRTNGPQTVEELAELTGADPVLLLRIVRHLSANNVLAQVGPNRYQQTELSLSFLNPVFGDWIVHTYDATLPSALYAPRFLKETGYQNPVDPSNGIFQYAKHTKRSMFDYYDTEPRESDTFNNIMGGVMMHQASWLDIFPHNTLLEGIDDHNAILVDVGGNTGRDLDRFRAAHPETASRLVLQDRAEVIKDTVCPEAVVKMAHDFFQPQPVKGARAYYMHGVLHDWSDEWAKAILKQVGAAMKPGYSKLLIHDHAIAEVNPHPHATAYDMTMMHMLGALERSESAWHKMLQETGFRIVKFWRSPMAAQSVIEAELI